MAGRRFGVTAAVCAYNEAANIEALLDTLLGRDASAFDELIVVVSGSTDGTDEIARRYEGRDSRLRLVVEPSREGKSSAVNTALKLAGGELILLIDGDCLPAPECLQRLGQCFLDPDVGGVGARNVVTNGREGPVARAGAVLWELHHLVCLREPVLGGDIVAFRNVIGGIPPETVNDDYVIESSLRSRGYRIAYEPEAHVLMRAPTTADDLLRQRRRIYAGFRDESRVGFTKSTQSTRLAAAATLALARRQPAKLPWLCLALGFEAMARLSVLAGGRSRRARYYTAWEPARTTKAALTPSDPGEGPS